MTRTVRVLSVLSVLAAFACDQKANEGRRMPKAPPVPNAPVDPTLSIAVTIDGEPAPAIDAARLEKTPATFAAEGKRAWRLDTLFGARGARDGVTYTVRGDGNVELVLKPPRSLAEPVPVISVNLRGEAMVALVAPGNPFPAFHGQGGRLGRPGDPMPRIGHVTAIAVAVGPRVPPPAP